MTDGAPSRAGEGDQLWVSDLTYVPTWAGIASVCFIIDVWLARSRR